MFVAREKGNSHGVCFSCIVADTFVNISSKECILVLYVMCALKKINTVYMEDRQNSCMFLANFVCF